MHRRRFVVRLRVFREATQAREGEKEGLQDRSVSAVSGKSESTLRDGADLETFRRRLPLVSDSKDRQTNLGHNVEAAIKTLLGHRTLSSAAVEHLNAAAEADARLEEWANDLSDRAAFEATIVAYENFSGLRPHVRETDPTLDDCFEEMATLAAGLQASESQ